MALPSPSPSPFLTHFWERTQTLPSHLLGSPPSNSQPLPPSFIQQVCTEHQLCA